MNKQVLCLNVKFVQLVDNTDSYKIRLRVRILKGKDGKMEFLIVTGLSGAGKSVTINALEDIGFYCVDNIPSKLVVTFYDLCERAKEDFSRVAVVTDIRGGALSDKFFEFLETFKERKVPYKILFLDAGDIVLVHRYKETRRRHPLSEAASGSLEQAVKMERELLRPMREAADYIIDIGPNAGRLGGEVVYQGDMKDLRKGSNSYTVRYLLGEEEIPVPEHRRPWNNYIELTGARENNLKGVNVRFPLNVMTVVTGVSGSGKSTLVRDIFYRALKRELDECSDRPGEFSSIGGSLRDLRNIEFVDQNPIGKSSRSNPVTYIKAYDEIRKLWSEQPLAKQMGYTAGHFSFNSEGGRCEECKGEGTITVEMQFMADLVLECESCHGKRFKADTLEVKFHDKNIYDVLEMTVNQAVEFFTEHGQKKIVKRLLPLQDVGLGYIKLGQSSSTLSGGENQRVKLAFYLSQEKADPTLFIFDEPTTGLHFHDIRKLLDAFDALIRRGHSIVIIEHNMDVIKCADYVIDLGPEGGDKGGNIVAVGTPEEVAACGASYTGQFLKEKLS